MGFVTGPNEISMEAPAGTATANPPVTERIEFEVSRLQPVIG
jgi:hypothetical protein